MSKVYVLSVWAHDKPPEDAGPPLRLSVFDEDAPGDGLELVASADTGFDTSRIDLPDGEKMDLATCLTTGELAKSDNVDAIGDELWRRISTGTIADVLTPVATSERVQLDLRNSSLRAYPWELLRIDNKTPFAFEEGDQPSRWSLGTPVIQEGAPSPTVSDHPLRILVVIGNDPNEEDDFKSGGEVFHIEALANTHKTDVLLNTLSRPSTAKLKKELERFRPHVFHFIGHGALNGDNPELLVYRPHPSAADPEVIEYRAERWDAGTIKDTFGLAAPRLVLLNACLTASSKRVNSSLPQAFLELGTRSVVAMTERILTDASIGFADYFYDAILSGTPVDAASTIARLSVRSLMPGATSQLENSWPLVRTFLNGPPEQVIELTVSGPVRMKWLKKDFIARWNERWDAWRSLDGSTSRLAVLIGERESGRTWMLNYVADSCHRAGDAVAYVTLGGKSGDWQSVLAEVATAVSKIKPADGIDASELLKLAASDGDREDVIEAFLNALETCSGDRRLLIAIDKLGRWSEDLVGQMLGELCEPFAVARAGSKTRMVITLCGSTDSIDFGIPENIWKPVEVGEFPEEEWGRSLTHYINAITKDDHERVLLHEFCDLMVRMDNQRSVAILAQSKDRLKAMRDSRGG